MKQYSSQVLFSFLFLPTFPEKVEKAILWSRCCADAAPFLFTGQLLLLLLPTPSGFFPALLIEILASL
jgi:hypothetical protein